MENSKGNREPMYAFIPRRLEIEGKPYLSVFPYHVLIKRYNTDEWGNMFIAEATYIPDFETYQDTGTMLSMRYLNKYASASSLLFSYDKSEKSYVCEKYLGETCVGLAEGGKDWNLFFLHVALLGIGLGETCKYEPMIAYVQSVPN